MGLKKELSQLIHKNSRESDSDTPDFILGEYLLTCLEAYEIAVNRRDGFYGLSHNMFKDKEKK